MDVPTAGRPSGGALPRPAWLGLAWLKRTPPTAGQRPLNRLSVYLKVKLRLRVPLDSAGQEEFETDVEGLLPVDIIGGQVSNGGSAYG